MIFFYNKNNFYSQRELLVLLGKQHVHWSFCSSSRLVLVGSHTVEPLLLLPLLFLSLIIKWVLLGSIIIFDKDKGAEEQCQVEEPK